jgi:nucleotide-binding universal stress UspA family protein
MIRLSRILVDIDAAAADHPALTAAAELAASCGAHLTIVDVLASVPRSARHFVTAALENELVAHRRERLQAIAGGIHGQPVTTELLRGRPGIALVREVLSSGHDLVIRSHVRDLAEGPKPFGAIDMELLRLCPCPVWLVGRHGSRDASRVVAAVSFGSTDADTAALNNSILEWALMLKQLRGGTLTVLHAWTVFGASVLRSRLPKDEFAACVAAARDTAQTAMSSLLKPFAGRLNGVDVEFVEGEPEGAITRFVESHGVDLVVMGTVARTGIPGLLMGNTAERVLQRLRASVLAVKPPEFVSPVAEA